MEQGTQATFSGTRALLSAAAAVIVIAGLKAASQIMIPLLIALFVSIVSLPLLALLERWRVPSLLAVFLTICADIAVLAFAGLLVTNSLNELVSERGKYEARVTELRHSVVVWTDDALDWLQDHGVPIESLSVPDPGATALPLEEPASDAQAATRAWSNLFDLNAVLDAGNRAVRGVAATITSLLVVVFIVTFILLEATTFRHKLRIAWRDPELERRVLVVTRNLRRYIGLKTAISLATGLLVTIWLMILGVGFAPLWGLIAFAFNFIPNIGSMVAAVPPVLWALLQGGLGSAALVALGFLVVNVVLGNILEPQIMGRSLGLSPLVVLLSLIFWGFVWGPVGMLLSVPLTMVLKILLESSPDFRWVAVLLEGKAQLAQRMRTAGASVVPVPVPVALASPSPEALPAEDSTG